MTMKQSVTKCDVANGIPARFMLVWFIEVRIDSEYTRMYDGNIIPNVRKWKTKEGRERKSNKLGFTEKSLRDFEQ